MMDLTEQVAEAMYREVWCGWMEHVQHQQVLTLDENESEKVKLLPFNDLDDAWRNALLESARVAIKATLDWRAMETAPQCGVVLLRTESRADEPWVVSARWNADDAAWRSISDNYRIEDPTGWLPYPLADPSRAGYAWK